MKMQADRYEGSNAIQRHGADGVVVNGVEHRRSMIVAWAGEPQAWDVDGFDALTEAHFARLAEFSPEIVLFGSGPRIRFAQPRWLRPLIGRRIGVETMDTAAACRTYNVLLGEGRKVLAALLIGNAQPL